MKVEEVKARVESIENTKYDDEVAHSMEDALWQDVLEAIAKGSQDSQALAEEALKTTKIKFARWCA